MRHYSARNGFTFPMARTIKMMLETNGQEFAKALLNQEKDINHLLMHACGDPIPELPPLRLLICQTVVTADR